MMNARLIKYDVNGQKIWDKTIGGSSLESFAELLIGPDGNIAVFLQGTSEKSGNLSEESKGETDIVVVRFNED